jgi:hypothetical protein
VIAVGEKGEEYRRKEMSEEKGEVCATSPIIVLVVSILTTNNQIKEVGLRVTMANQDTTLRLPMFHGIGMDDKEQHWFTCKEIWYVKRIIDKATNIMYWKPHSGIDP